MAYLRDVRITLIGKTGVGKSAVGNTILHMNRFTTGSGSSSVTRRCKKETAGIAGRTVTVVDTPDFFSSTHEVDLVTEIERSVSLSSPGVHAFLYVLKPTTFTKQEAETVSQFKQTYGEEVFRHTIVLFTHGDQLQRVNMDRLIQQNELLMNLVRLCDGRFTVLNNENPADRDQVPYLLDIIDRMVSNNESSFYTLEMLQEAQRRAEEQREMSLAEQHRQEESARIKHQMDLERAERETEIRVRKEMEEELQKVRAEIEAAKYRTEEETDMEDVVQDQENKTICWFVSQQKHFYVIAVFCLSMGYLFSKVYADRWRFVRGCGLGGSAAALGMITGKLWVLIWRSQIRMSCSSPQQSPYVYQYLKKAFGVLCGGLFGSGLGFMGSDQTSVVLLAAVAGAAGAYTAMHRIC